VKTVSKEEKAYPPKIGAAIIGPDIKVRQTNCRIGHSSALGRVSLCLKPINLSYEEVQK